MKGSFSHNRANAKSAATGLKTDDEDPIEDCCSLQRLSLYLIGGPRLPTLRRELLTTKAVKLGLVVFEHVAQQLLKGAAIRMGRSDGVFLILSVEPVTTELVGEIIACVMPAPRTFHNLSVEWLDETIRDASCASFARYRLTLEPPAVAAEDAELIRCNHGEVATCRKVKTMTENYGREFFCCPKPQKDHCKFFEWKATKGPTSVLGKEAYTLILMVNDTGDTAFHKLCETLRRVCDIAVHRHCFVRDGTRHVTLGKGKWTEAEAASVCFRVGAMTTLPMELSLASPKPWLTCLALGVTHATAVSIAQLVSELVLPVDTMLQTDPSMLHLSLYRSFGISEALQEQIEKMGSELLRTTSFGTVQKSLRPSSCREEVRHTMATTLQVAGLYTEIAVPRR